MPKFIHILVDMAWVNEMGYINYKVTSRGERGVIISRDWRWPVVVPVITSQRVVLAFPLLFPHCTAGSEFQSSPDLQSPQF